ncbi:MAG: type III polyketide synthase [Proteobacteria bacterium]|nr:type III polyketide synthase [Pseudomonadota bacterium]
MERPPIRLNALATAVPAHVLGQGEVEAAAARVFARQSELFERLKGAYANAGIERRHSCVPLEWYLAPHGWKERQALFGEYAVALFQAVAERCLRRAGLGVEAIDAVISVTSTGIATPSLDAVLVERMGFRRDVARVPLFGLGCAGGVLGLARAAALARSAPGSRVLLLVVELCGLTFRMSDLSKSNLIATALFGDGAAGAVVSTAGGGPVVAGWGEHTWPASLGVMGWNVEDDGFGVLFSRDIPALVRERMAEAARGALAAMGLGLADIDRVVSHPGGAKVIVALEEALGLAPGTMAEAREVLRTHGNMSSATVFFVLERVLAGAARAPERYLLTALGPGFTAAFLVLERG